MSVETVDLPETVVREKLPPWMIPVFAFLAGVALMYAVMNPINSTPDYQRGHAEGYKQGLADKGSVQGESQHYERGWTDGFRTAQKQSK